jgi:hypothetical protein
MTREGETMTITLQDAITAINAGDKTRGKQLLSQLLQQDPQNEAAWIWMSGTVEDAEQRRFCLQRALVINPANATALAGLASLEVQPPAPTPPPLSAPTSPTPLARMDHGLGQVTPPDTAPSPELPKTSAFVWPREEAPTGGAPIIEEIFIGDIVATMNKDESSATLPQDSDLDWLLKSDETPSLPTMASEDALRGMFSGIGQDYPGNQSLDGEPETTESGAGNGVLDFGQDLNTELNTRLGTSHPAVVPAFVDLKEADFVDKARAPIPTPGLKWVNPRSHIDQLTLLTEKYLVTSSPDPMNRAQIEALLKEGQIQRNLLGNGVKIFALNKINRVCATGNSEIMEVTILKDNSLRTQTISFASPAVRNEVFQVLKTRLGDMFQFSVEQTNLLKALLIPGITLAVLGLISGILYYGSLQLKINPQRLNDYLGMQIDHIVPAGIFSAGPWVVLCLGGGLIMGVLVWLVYILSRPRHIEVLERKSG